MKTNGSITILIDREKTTIELYDDDAGITFAKIELTAEQFCSALSRQAYTKCGIDIWNTEKIGKKMEHKEFEFALPRSGMRSSDSDELYMITKVLLRGTGWVADKYFSKQNTFFEKDGRSYARCTIRRWVDKPEEL